MSACRRQEPPVKTTCPAKMKVVASTAAMVPGGIDFCRQESKVGGEGNTHTAVGERKWLWAHAPPRSPEVAACPFRTRSSPPPRHPQLVQTLARPWPHLGVLEVAREVGARQGVGHRREEDGQHGPEAVLGRAVTGPPVHGQPPRRDAHDALVRLRLWFARARWRRVWGVSGGGAKKNGGPAPHQWRGR